MPEPAHRPQWNRLRKDWLRGGRHIKIITMILHQRIACAICRFFTGNPAVPWCGAARTIAHRACEAEKLPYQAAAFRVVHQRGGAAEAGWYLLAFAPPARVPPYYYM